MAANEEDVVQDDSLLGSSLAKHGFLATSPRVLDDAGPTDIQRFYSGASVLVTGATGFMGKVLIEKLLWACPDIDSIYMVVREKKGRSLDERIDDLIASRCFDRVKKENPDFRSKLRVVSGDMGAVGLGISDADRLVLKQRVNIVFNMAANVRFDEHLKFAILQNVRGTREILDLCRTFRNIKSIVHVSTAYSNCTNTQIDERFYKPHIPTDHAIHMAETQDVDTIDRLSHKLTGEWPNTYAFTKALSEEVVRKHGQGLPIGVFRPSVVVCTYKEPSAGWIDNMYGPTGVLVATSAGLLRTMQVREETEANLVPCDLAVSALIASARDIVDNRSAAEMPVYNFVSPKSNRLTWKRLKGIYREEGSAFPPERMLWYPIMVAVGNGALYLLVRLFVHFLPALVMDICFLATNQKPQMLRIYRKVHKFTNVIAYFSTKEWIFENKNVENMWNGLKEGDKKLFPFDMDSLDWFRFIRDTCIGVRLNILKDPPETVPAARIKYTRFKILHHSLQCLLGIIAMWVSIKVLPLIGATLLTAAERCGAFWVMAGKRLLLNEIN